MDHEFLKRAPRASTDELLSLTVPGDEHRRRMIDRQSNERAINGVGRTSQNIDPRRVRKIRSSLAPPQYRVGSETYRSYSTRHPNDRRHDKCKRLMQSKEFSAPCRGVCSRFFFWVPTQWRMFLLRSVLA